MASNFPSSILSGRNSSAYGCVLSSAIKCHERETYVLAPDLGIPVHHVNVAHNPDTLLQGVLPASNDRVFVRTGGADGSRRSEAEALSHDGYNKILGCGEEEKCRDVPMR